MPPIDTHLNQTYHHPTWHISSMGNRALTQIKVWWGDAKRHPGAWCKQSTCCLTQRRVPWGVWIRGVFGRFGLVDSIFFWGKTERIAFFFKGKKQGGWFFVWVMVWVGAWIWFGRWWKMIKKYCFRRCCSEWMFHSMRLTRNLKSVFFGWCAFDLFIHWESLIIQHRRYCGYWSGFRILAQPTYIDDQNNEFFPCEIGIYIYIERERGFFQSGLPWQCAKPSFLHK